MANSLLESLFVASLSTWQLYGLFFLLGSFTVATLSDLRRLSAQREFVEIWALFALAMLGLDLYRIQWSPDWMFGVKWGLILVLSLLSWRRVGLLFRLAAGDVWACAALAGLLPVGFVVAFWVLLKGTSWIEAPLLPKQGGSYPFMPVVTTAALLVLALAIVVVPWALRMA